MIDLLDHLIPRRLIGATISASELHLAGIGTWPLEAYQPGNQTWPALEQALRDALRDARSALTFGEQETARLTVALMPPLVSFRAVELPKLRAADLSAILARNVTRYFPSVRDKQVVAAEYVSSPNSEKGQYALVSAAADLLAGIEAAATACNCSIERFVPAASAWAAFAAQHGSKRSLPVNIVITRNDGGIDCWSAVRGVPYELQRWRNAEIPETSPPHHAVRITEPADAAARNVGRTRILELVTDSIARRKAGQKKRQRMVLGSFAVLLLVMGLGGFAINTHRALSDIKAQRSALAGDVAKVLQVDSALQSVVAPATALARVEEHGARWAEIVSDLATALPPDAFIMGLRASGDTVTIDGAAQNGARVFEAVSASNLLTGITPVGSIRRDAQANTEDTSNNLYERFTLQGRVSNATRLVPPATKGKRR